MKYTKQKNGVRTSLRNVVYLKIDQFKKVRAYRLRQFNAKLGRGI